MNGGMKQSNPICFSLILKLLYGLLEAVQCRIWIARYAGKNYKGTTYLQGLGSEYKCFRVHRSL